MQSENLQLVIGDKNLSMKEMFTLMDKNIFEFIIKKASM